MRSRVTNDPGAGSAELTVATSGVRKNRARSRAAWPSS